MIMQKIRERKLSVIGIFFILLALDVLVRNELVIYDTTPQLGDILPYVKAPEPTKELPPIVIKLISWPFYVPLLVGGTCIGLDANQVIKYRKLQKETEQEYGKKFENEVV
jgi:hypothetical protein